MKKMITRILCLAIVTSILLPSQAYAWKGDCGYEGGISSRQTTYKTQRKAGYEYQEVLFISGEPIVFSGTLTIEKSLKNEQVTTKYQYNLENKQKSASLERKLEFLTTRTKKENGQTVEKTEFNKEPSETVKIGDTVYAAEEYEFKRSDLVDSKPAIDYFAGDIWSRKLYRLGDGTGTVEVEATGNFYGYGQYWGTTEVQTIRYIIQSERKKGNKVDRWGGTANVSLSSSTVKQLQYIKNEPDQISFDGGYIQAEYAGSVLECACRLPEFDKNGEATDHMISVRNSLKTESFPTPTRLIAPAMRHLRGHWAEDDIKILFSLEVFNGDAPAFQPEQYMTRAEFTSAMIRAAKEVPGDPSLEGKTRSRTTRTRRSSGEKIVSPFQDVPVGSVYFTAIDTAHKRGIITGGEGGMFYPNGKITMAEAVTIFIRALGLESLSPGPHAVTAFRDNDDIPHYAREAVYVAEKIGLIQGDGRGYLRPNENITQARAAALLNRFLRYMSDGIRKDYRDRIVNYN